MEPVVWVVGFVRDPSISYTIVGQTDYLRPYYTTEYHTVEAAVRAMINSTCSLLLTVYVVAVLYLGLQHFAQPSGRAGHASAGGCGEGIARRQALRHALACN